MYSIRNRLNLFRVVRPYSQGVDGRVRVLWLGRIVPRKRLDLFLDACRVGIERGLPIELTVVGDTRYFAGYGRLLEDFPFPEKLKWHKNIERRLVPDLIAKHDCLLQPSEERLWSAVAEAQACGRPVVVGKTNGTGDYVCPNSIRLEKDTCESLFEALKTLVARIKASPRRVADQSRSTAELFYSLKVSRLKL